MDIPLSGSFCPLFLEFGVLVFLEGGNSEKNCTILTSNSYCSLYFLYFLKTHT